MFAADGGMLHCNVRSNLMALLEKLPMEAEGVPNSKQNSVVQNKGETKDGVGGTHAAVNVVMPWQRSRHYKSLPT